MLCSDQSLDLRGLEDGLLAILGDLAADDVLADIISLLEVEELADLGRALGTQAAGLLRVGQTLDLGLALLDDDEVEHGEIGGDDAAAGRLALALTALADAVAGHAIAEEQAHALSGQHSLLHGETLLVVSSRDLEHIALEVISKAVSRNLVRDTLVIERAPARTRSQQPTRSAKAQHISMAHHGTGRSQWSRAWCRCTIGIVYPAAAGKRRDDPAIAWAAGAVRLRASQPRSVRRHPTAPASCTVFLRERAESGLREPRACNG